MRSLVMCGLIVMLLASAAFAAVPKTLSYQGMLRDNDGNIVPDGTYDAVFRIYAVATGGTVRWSEPDTVLVTDGVFSTILGDLYAINLAFDRQYWLSIEIEATGELSPRIELTSSPYARIAGAVDLPYDGYVDTSATAFAVGNTAGNGIYASSRDAMGVVGWSTNSDGVWGKGGAIGVYGSSDAGVGVYGFNVNTSNFGGLGSNAFGAYGKNQTTGNWGYFGDANYGVYGYSASGYAGYFEGKAKTSGTLEVGNIARIQGTTWPSSGKSMELAYDSSLHRGYLQVYDRAGGPTAWGDLYMGSTRVGFGISTPARLVHIKDVMRLEPRADYPSSPSDGDLCVVGASGSRHIYCYLNGAWRQMD